MADTSKINLGQLKTALIQAKEYTDSEIAAVTGVTGVEPNDSDMPKVFFYGDKPTNKNSVYATIEYISEGGYYLVTYENGMYRAWGAIKTRSGFGKNPPNDLRGKQ